MIDMGADVPSQALLPKSLLVLPLRSPLELMVPQELCILDVVKHALRVIIKSLNADDRLAIVPFSSRASVSHDIIARASAQHSQIAADLTLMDDAGKRTINTIVNNLRPSGSTNLWDGLKTGMNILNPSARAEIEASGALPRFHPGAQLPAYSDTQDHQRIASVFILTDGVPNVTPPRGHVPMLQRYLAANPLLNFSINTFGFGYSLNSQLLFQIAEIGGGHYGFVPDLGMLGTVFIHALANTLSTYAVDCAVEIEYDAAELELAAHGTPAVSAELGVREEPRRDVLRISVGKLQFGQTRDLILIARPRPGLNLDGSAESATPQLTVLASYQPLSRSKQLGPLTSTSVLHARYLQDGSTLEGQSHVLHHALRISFASSLLSFFPRDLTSDLLPTQRVPAVPAPDSDNYIAFNDLSEEMARQQHPAAADAQGQARMALEPGHWERWGRHMLPSMARAHLRQRCSNFRDPGQLVYGSASPLFIRERDQADEAFDNLPAPRPGRYSQHWDGPASRRGGASQSASRTKVSTMSVWNSRTGPCFAGDCRVRLHLRDTARVDELRRGDVVATPAGPRCVVAIVRTRIAAQTLLCNIGENLRITPWHPVRIDNVWRFPAAVVAPTTVDEIQCSAVYSLLLEPSPNPDSHAVWVGGVLCVTLGSGAPGDIRAHPFLSDYASVVRALSSLSGWNMAEGVLDCLGTARHSDGTICGFVADNAHVSSPVETACVEILGCA